MPPRCSGASWPEAGLGARRLAEPLLPRCRAAGITVVRSFSRIASEKRGRSHLKTRSHHETHLPAFESPPRPHARVPHPHEDARRPRRDQRAARQGPQAPVVGLSRRARKPLAVRFATAMLGRLLRSADFARALAVPPRARSAHFAAHHVAQAPARGRRRSTKGRPPRRSSPRCAPPEA